MLAVQVRSDFSPFEIEEISHTVMIQSRFLIYPGLISSTCCQITVLCVRSYDFGTAN